MAHGARFPWIGYLRSWEKALPQPPARGRAPHAPRTGRRSGLPICANCKTWPWRGAEVTTVGHAEEKSIHAVTAVLSVLRRVDPTLRRDAVRPARTFLATETLHVLALPAKDRGPGTAGQTCSHHDDFIPPRLGRAHPLARHQPVGLAVFRRPPYHASAAQQTFKRAAATEGFDPFGNLTVQ